MVKEATERLQVRAELAQIEADQAQQTAETTCDQAIQAKSQFLSCMSHEIRTPMNNILGYLSLITLLRLEEPDRQNTQQDIDGGRASSTKKRLRQRSISASSGCWW